MLLPQSDCQHFTVKAMPPHPTHASLSPTLPPRRVGEISLSLHLPSFRPPNFSVCCSLLLKCSCLRRHIYSLPFLYLYITFLFRAIFTFYCRLTTVIVQMSLAFDSCRRKGSVCFVNKFCLTFRTNLNRVY